MWNLHILEGAMQQRNCKDLLSACLVALSNGESGFQNPENFCLRVRNSQNFSCGIRNLGLWNLDYS